MKSCFLASHNPGKQREFSEILEPLDWRLIQSSEIGFADVPETGRTFVENALIKARAGAAHSRLPTLADDSGLVVPALNGDPGVYSARYAGDTANSDQNINKLLQNMDQKTDRTAFFYCVLVFLQHADDPMPLIAQGCWSGQLTESPKGKGGFGYDPVFLTESGKTAAELTPEEKHTISHRGQALRSLVRQIEEMHSMLDRHASSRSAEMSEPSD